MHSPALHVKHCHPERLVPDELSRFGKQLYNDHAARYNFAKKYIKNKKVLDIACGSGYGSLLMMNAKPYAITAVDNSKDAVSYAKERYPHKKITYKTGDAIKIPLKDKSVDVVVSFETIEHVKNYRRFIKEIQRVLKENGILILSTPNKNLGTEETNPFHFKEFYLDEFKELLNVEFEDVRLYGQKPIHLGYLKLVSKITHLIPPGKLNWFVDSSFKYFFRGTAVEPIKKFRYGFTPSYLIGVAKKKKI